MGSSKPYTEKQSASPEEMVKRGYEIGEQLFRQGCRDFWREYYFAVYSSPIAEKDLLALFAKGFHAGYEGKALPRPEVETLEAAIGTVAALADDRRQPQATDPTRRKPGD